MSIVKIFVFYNGGVMNIYDTLIIGSSYSSVGFATAKGNCVICEENQICDTQFYLPLRSFGYVPYAPRTDEGKDLYEIFTELSLFSGDMQNANGFECGLCKYLLKNPCEILLKCRVIDINERDGIYEAKIQTNGGISHLYAKSILDTRASQENTYHTTLFVCQDERELEVLTSAFPDSYIEKAFYSSRYALHVPTNDFDENTIKLHVYEKWNALGIQAKILYMAPTFFGRDKRNGLCDGNYQNPIEAFECGYFYAKGGAK